MPRRCRRFQARQRCCPVRARARRWRSLASRVRICRCTNSIRWRTPDAARLAETALAWAGRQDRRDAGRDRRLGAARSGRRDRNRRLADPIRPARLLEDAMARIADGLVSRGVRRMVVAGGETSGAVVDAAWRADSCGSARRSIRACPGRYASGDGADLLLALKSGNFGATDFFLKAFQMLEGATQ